MPIHNFDFHLGVDMTGREQDTHFRALENLWRRHDSESDGTSEEDGIGRAIERTVGFRRLLTANEKIHSLFHSESDGSLFIHAGKRLYRLTERGRVGVPESDEEEDEHRTSLGNVAYLRLTGRDSAGVSERIYEFLPERPIAAASVGNRLYFADGLRLYCFADSTFTLVASLGACTVNGLAITSVTEPYVPLRLLDGVEYEQRNLLTDRYRISHTFRPSDNLCHCNAPLTFTRLGKNSEGVECCRADFCVRGDYGNTLVIPSSTVVDGTLCAVTELSQAMLSYEERYNILVMPASMPVIPPKTLINCQAIHTVRLPIGVTNVDMSFFNGCSLVLRIEYEGTAEQWARVQVHTSDYKGTYTVSFGYSDVRVPFGLPLPDKSGSVGMMYLDGKPIENKLSDYFHFFPLPGSYEDDAPYTGIYILARTNNLLNGKTLTLSARAMPFYYTSTDSTHLLATTEGALRESGTESGNAQADKTATPEGQALLRGCRLLASYDRRLFFSGLPAVPDAIFYSHEDADGNPNPTYVAVMNYMTDGDRMPVTGLYSAGGELCVTHASRTRGKLQTHTYALPDTSNALFIRLYPVKAVYSTGCVRAAAVYGGRLHLLTDDGIFVYTRDSSDGYLNGRRVSGRISPVIASIAKEAGNGGKLPFFSSLGNRLALFHGTSLYLGDSVLTANASSEYEWYPQSGIGSYGGDEKAYCTCLEMPESLREAFFIGENNEFIPLTLAREERICGEGEVEVRTAKTLVDGRFYDHTVYCEKESGALVDRLSYRIGGTLHAPTAVALWGSLLVFGTEDGALLAFNTDDSYERAGEPYYLCDGHRTTAYLHTFAEKNDRYTAHKRTRTGTSHVFLRAMPSSAPTLTLHFDGRDISLVLPAAPFEFDRLEFDKLGFTHSTVAALPVPEPYDYVEKSYTLFSDMPFAFLGLTYTYDIKK